MVARTKMARASGVGTAPATCAVHVLHDDRLRRVRHDMLPDEVLQDVADTFKLLAHPTRVRIVRALVLGELCVCDLAEVVGLSISATSHQLQMMRRAGLLRHRSEGKQVFYRLGDAFLPALLEDGVRHVTRNGAST